VLYSRVGSQAVVDDAQDATRYALIDSRAWEITFGASAKLKAD